MPADKELLQNRQFLIPNTHHLLAMVMGTCVSINPTQPRLHVTTWKCLGLDVRHVPLPINVKESNNGFSFLCGSDVLSCVKLKAMLQKVKKHNHEKRSFW